MNRPMSRLVTGFLIVLIVAFVTGCATVPLVERKPPPSIPEIIKMSRDGVPEDEIIRQLHESDAVYRLSGSELAKLKDDGVTPKVLDYLHQAQLNQARYDEWARVREPIFYGPYFGFHYYYGHPRGPWPYHPRWRR
jgi:hypothetical protein